MGELEKLNKNIELLIEKIDDLPTASGAGTTQLIDGKANLNPKEAAEFLGMGEQTLRELAHSNQIPHIKNGRYFLFPVSELYNWLRITANKNFDDIKDPDVLQLVNNG